MRLGIVSVGLLVLAYACGGDGGAPRDATGSGEGGEAPAAGKGANGGATAQAGSAASSGGKSGSSAGNPPGPGGSAAAGQASEGGMPGEPQAGAAQTLGGAADGGAGGAGGAETVTVVDNPVVPGMTKFIDYGTLRIAFTSPVTAATLVVALAPLKPSKLLVVEVKQVDATTVDALLLDYHLPRDYQLSVAGKLADGTPFQSSATLSGLNNGARVAFLTKQSGTGNVKGWPGASPTAVTGRDAADGICQGEADAAGLRGTFVAFLSEQGAYDAGCRAFGLDGLLVNKCGQQQAPVDDAPWLGTTGLPIVGGASRVVSSQWQNAFTFFADGTRSQQIGVWTGTLDGAKAQTGAPGPSSVDCFGWTKDTSFAETGEFTGEYLLRYGAFASGCGTGHGLICLQVGGPFFGASTLHEVGGKRAFISKGQLTGKMSFGGKTGVEAADALCQSEAVAATYANANKFHAYLSTTATDAVCHILGLTGKVGTKCGLAALPDTDPWRRADNYPIGTAAQLVKSNLTAPVALAADGSPAFDQRPWTGTNSNGSVYTTCSDWTVDDAGTGVCGYGRALTNGWSFYTDANCSFSEPVFCFEN